MGLASRAELTLFDEPYLGLDAVARAAFFDALLADVAERPRTVLLSTHHIDEAADLLERVVVLDRGKVVVDEEADALRAQAYEVSGRAAAVAEFTEARDVTELRKLGALATASVRGVLTTQDRQRAEHLQLELAPVSLQALFVHLVQDEGSSRSGGTPSEPDLGSSSEADASTTSRTLGRSRS